MINNIPFAPAYIIKQINKTSQDKFEILLNFVKMLCLFSKSLSKIMWGVGWHEEKVKAD